MGGACAKSGGGDTEGDRANKAADEILTHDAELQNLNFKVLLLGAGETGKSTLVKQLKLINKIPVDEIEMENYATNIHQNVVQCMKTFVDAAKNLNLTFSDPEHARMAAEISEYDFGENKRMPKQFADYVQTLWATPVIQEAYSHRSEYWFLDASEYYFANVHRLIEDDYRPSEEDCLMTRIRTTGLSVTEFDDPPVHFQVVDVGGQRNERKKWMHCFDDVKCLLFFVNLAGYDQVMFEDPTQNRMQESIQLFATTANNPIFADTPLFLFLNKKDLLEQMIKRTPFTKCFPEYTGEDDVAQAIEYVSEQFKRQLTNKAKTVHTIAITARVRKDVKDCWSEVRRILLEENKASVQKAQKNLKGAPTPSSSKTTSTSKS
ncbi:G-protein subunit alpha 8 [Pelomyxa schiedti]|nr:G-protein subunit alpha 8 [Pelomyxa schiedti]